MHSKRQRYDYGSEFSGSENDADPIAKYDRSLMEPSHSSKMGLFHSSSSRSRAVSQKLPSKRSFDSELDKQEGKRMRYHGILAMDAFARHQKFVNDYLIYYGGKREDFKQTRKSTTEKEIIKENNKFLWKEENVKLTWDQQLAYKYWKKLYKEYTIADLSRFKEDKIALRWRIEKEVISGKGQFMCGNKSCNETEGLRSWEVNFAYLEHGEKKNALVKLRLCPECSYKLNYRKKKKEAKRRKHDKASKHQCENVNFDSNSNEPTNSLKASSSSTTANTHDHEQRAWTRPPVQEDMTREDEFDKYFDDMFL